MSIPLRIMENQVGLALPYFNAQPIVVLLCYSRK